MTEIAFAIHWPAGPPPRPAPDAARRRFHGQTMGTTWQVDLFGLEGRSDPSIQAGIEGELERLVLQMSHWRGDSELSRFSRAAAGEWVCLSREFLDVLEAAVEVCRLSGGAFDPAVAPVVDAWGFGPSQATPRTAPPHAPLAGSVGQIEIDRERGCARQPGGVHLDLSAIAKGYGADHLARFLSELGAASFLVEIGGEFRGEGLKPDAQPWWIDLETPPGQTPQRQIRMALSGLAVATSGDYRHFSMLDGQRFSHTIDPATGAPVRHAIASVTVIHQHCHLADAFSTAIFVLGPRAGLEFATRHSVAAAISERSGEELKTTLSPAFESLLAP